MVGVTADSKTEQKLQLKDGRTLGFAECGDPDGRPVLYFHGWPSSRLEAGAYDEAGRKVGARVIGIDRPGIGLSTLAKGYRVIDWPRDVTELADALGIEKFAAVAISSGAPYGLACAALIPERLTACAIVSGVAPLSVDGEKIDAKKHIIKTELQIVGLAKTAPVLARLGMWYVLRQARKDPEKAMNDFLKDMPESDRRIMQDEDLKQQFEGNFLEAARQGTKGLVASIALEGRPWGFRLQDITMRVSLWHGEDDNTAFPAGVAYVASKLPNHTLHTIPKAGHIATVFGESENVLRELLSA